ncbi:hypothetical protein, partial [Vibrio vulnificus]|uniref:hypothetical protein n=1 Tax=Vibrio vulnificus TaxID=672 RepID=UPI00287BC4B5
MLKIERNSSKLHQSTKPSKITRFISPKHSALAAFLPLATNAQLSGEQRTNQPAAHHLKHPKSPH